jgi:hypothetical protein
MKARVNQTDDIANIEIQINQDNQSQDSAAARIRHHGRKYMNEYKSNTAGFEGKVLTFIKKRNSI